MSIKHLTITDMPRDPQGILGTTRRTLLNLFNKFRTNKTKMILLKEVLDFMSKEVDSAISVMEEAENKELKTTNKPVKAVKKTAIKKETK